MKQYTKEDVKAACFAENRNDRREWHQRVNPPFPFAPMNEEEQAMYARAQEINGRLLSCRRDSMRNDEETILDWMTPPHGGSRPSSDAILSEVYYNAHTGHIVWIATHKEVEGRIIGKRE